MAQTQGIQEITDACRGGIALGFALRRATSDGVQILEDGKAIVNDERLVALLEEGLEGSEQIKAEWDDFTLTEGLQLGVDITQFVQIEVQREKESA